LVIVLSVGLEPDDPHCISRGGAEEIRFSVDAVIDDAAYLVDRGGLERRRRAICVSNKK